MTIAECDTLEIFLNLFFFCNYIFAVELIANIYGQKHHVGREPRRLIIVFANGSGLVRAEHPCVHSL